MARSDAKRPFRLLEGRMAPIVFAIGAVMVAAGCGEIYYGSGIIEIERGWSTFIAGTVLLTGGLLTVAVGLALRSLAEVKGALLQLGELAARGSSSATPHDPPEIAAPLREPPMMLRPAEAMTLAPAGSAPQIEPHFGAARGAADEPDMPLRLHDEPAGRPATAQAPSGHEPGAEEPPQLTPAMDDWLDQEFGELDRDIRQLHAPAEARAPGDAMAGGGSPGPEAATAPPPPRLAEHAPDAPAQATSLAASAGDELLYADYVELAPAAPAAPQPAGQAQAPVSLAADAAPGAPAGALPSPAPAQPAVIGRYEADGTSYVMFADGSIEAQSEAGIYRFASMAELKSFIET